MEKGREEKASATNNYQSGDEFMLQFASMVCKLWNYCPQFGYPLSADSFTLYDNYWPLFVTEMFVEQIAGCLLLQNETSMDGSIAFIRLFIAL